jgi:hypothetical protein
LLRLLQSQLRTPTNGTECVASAVTVCNCVLANAPIAFADTLPGEHTSNLGCAPLESVLTATCLNGTSTIDGTLDDCDDDASAILFMPDMLFANSKPMTPECSTGNVAPIHPTGTCFDDDAFDILFWPDLLLTNNCDSTLCHDNGEPSPTAANSDVITDSDISQSDAEDLDIIFMPDLLFASDGEHTPAAVPVAANTTSWATVPDADISDILFMPDLMFTAAFEAPVCCNNGEASPPEVHSDTVPPVTVFDAPIVVVVAFAFCIATVDVFWCFLAGPMVLVVEPHRLSLLLVSFSPSLPMAASVRLVCW